MKAEQIEVVRKWPKPKSVQDIQIFLGFANFYCQFIKGFNKIAAPLMSILKTTILSQMLSANEVLDARVLAADKVDDVGGSGDRLSDRLKRVEPKTRRSESQKSSKSQKLAKSKKLSKSGNLPNFDVENSGPSFLTPKARITFNCLWLAFTKAPIL